MVKPTLTTSICSLISCLLVFCACRQKPNFPPRLNTGSVSDTAQVIRVLPDEGAVAICKNGYRVFDLDSIVADEDDPDSTIAWSLAPGPSLEVRLVGSRVEVVPLPNWAGEDHVVFTATDPGGLSASRTCPVLVFDEFVVESPLDTFTVARSSTRHLPVRVRYRTGLQPGLRWSVNVSSSTLLPVCRLNAPIAPDTLTLTAGGQSGTAGVYFTVRDTVNHATFHYSSLVTVR